MDVEPRAPEAGWSVTVRSTGFEAAFTLDAVTVEVDGIDLTVPGPGPAELGRLLTRIDTRQTEDGDVRDYGNWLFDRLLAPVWDDVRKLPDVVAAHGVELALRWPVDAAVLHGLSWEAMCPDRVPLANDPDLLVAITRIVPAHTGPVHTVDRTPKVLFVSGGELLDDTIRPGAMFMGLLRALDAEGVCAAKAVQGVDSDGLARHCAEFQPDVVHLVAHGDVVGGHGKLKLGRDQWAGADVLVPALTGARKPLAVVLSACRSGSGRAEPMPSGPLAAELVARGIPIVSAVAGEVSEQACRLYSKRLVAAISDGTPLARAVAEGRRAALQATEPGRHLDWAMPALFMAESVPADFRPVDRTSADRLVAAARQLQLRKSPVFIGRETVLSYVDEMFDPRRPLGVIGLLRDGSVSRLGGTRLLREMGYQLLLRGHLPLLLGPYGPATEPGDFRTFLAEVFGAVDSLSDALGLPVPAFESLDGCYPAVCGTDARGSRRALELARTAFCNDNTELVIKLATDSLGHDLGELARCFAGHGPPFGEHTRVVLLADELHRWPVLAQLRVVLDRAVERGFGTRERPVPFVFTGSSREDSGPLLKSLSDIKYGQPGYAFPMFEPLDSHEALLGFQWILLNPWLRDNNKVYAALPGAKWDVVRSLFDLFLKGMPAQVDTEDFYRLADALVQNGDFVAGDDHAAWQQYQKLA